MGEWGSSVAGKRKHLNTVYDVKNHLNEHSTAKTRLTRLQLRSNRERSRTRLVIGNEDTIGVCIEKSFHRGEDVLLVVIGVDETEQDGSEVAKSVLSMLRKDQFCHVHQRNEIYTQNRQAGRVICHHLHAMSAYRPLL